MKTKGNKIYKFSISILIICIIWGCSQNIIITNKYMNDSDFNEIFRRTLNLCEKEAIYDIKYHNNKILAQLNQFTDFSITSKQQKKFDDALYPYFFETISTTKNLDAVKLLCATFPNSVNKEKSKELWENLLISEKDHQIFKSSLMEYKKYYQHNESSSNEFNILIKRVKEQYNTISNHDQIKVFLEEQVYLINDCRMNEYQWDIFKKEVLPIYLNIISETKDLSICSDFCSSFANTPIRDDIDEYWRNYLIDTPKIEEFYKYFNIYQLTFGEKSEIILRIMLNIQIDKALKTKRWDDLLDFINRSVSHKNIREMAQKEFDSKLSDDFLSSSNVNELSLFIKLFPLSILRDKASEKLQELMLKEEEDNFKQVYDSNNIKIMKKYIESSPPEKYKHKVYQRLAVLVFEKIYKAKDAKILRDFARQYSSETVAQKANELAANLEWHYAQISSLTRQNNLNGLILYLKNYPDSPYIDLAQFNLEKLQFIKEINDLIIQLTPEPSVKKTILSTEEIAAFGKKTCVRIETDNVYGSGVFINSNGLILTNWHVIGNTN
ncbi:MAG: hypothetical protein NT106_14865, partial [Candidatus Sumerlaeota bacterium]|nr:hypothetical protein [Candidatus Sumerlaeota bacterium]